MWNFFYAFRSIKSCEGTDTFQNVKCMPTKNLISCKSGLDGSPETQKFQQAYSTIKKEIYYCLLHMKTENEIHNIPCYNEYIHKRLHECDAMDNVPSHDNPIGGENWNRICSTT